MTSLSVKLGEKEFMFGSHPTSLDAVVFAYLAPLLKAPFKNPVLQNHLKSCTNLQKYVSRICQRYFSQDYQGKEICKILNQIFTDFLYESFFFIQFKLYLNTLLNSLVQFVHYFSVITQIFCHVLPCKMLF